MDTIFKVLEDVRDDHATASLTYACKRGDRRTWATMDQSTTQSLRSALREVNSFSQKESDDMAAWWARMWADRLDKLQALGLGSLVDERGHLRATPTPLSFARKQPSPSPIKQPSPSPITKHKGLSSVRSPAEMQCDETPRHRAPSPPTANEDRRKQARKMQFEDWRQHKVALMKHRQMNHNIKGDYYIPPCIPMHELFAKRIAEYEAQMTAHEAS